MIELHWSGKWTDEEKNLIRPTAEKLARLHIVGVLLWNPTDGTKGFVFAHQKR